MTRSAARVGVAIAALAIAGPAFAQPDAAPCAPRDLMARTGFTPREIAQIERGVPVARVLDTDRREVAVIGAVRIRAPRDRLAARIRTIDYLKGGPARARDR